MGRAITLMSASGGQGKSTLACYLASAFVAEGHSVLLIDCGTGYGSLRWLLGQDLGSSYDLGDACRGECLMGDSVFRCDRGFYMMPSAANDDGVTALKICRIIEAAKKSFDFIITDCPSAGRTDTELFAGESDLPIICAAANRMNLAHASWLRRALPEYGMRNAEDEISRFECRLVLMKFSYPSLKRGECDNIDTAIDTVGARLLGIIPEDLLISSIKSGLGLPKNCPSALAARDIAGRILGRDIPLNLKSII